MDFNELIDLAATRFGGAVLLANDEFFAPKERLIAPEPPEWREHAYTERGKWMDGWETRRRREPGHDWCIIRLGARGIVRGVVVDTSHFRGNYPEACSLDGCDAPAGADPTGLARAAAWRTLLPRAALAGHEQNRFVIDAAAPVTHLRLNVFPDGGVARLRVHGEVVPDWDALARRGDIDLAAAEHGGLVVACSDMFFGGRHNLIMPGTPHGMHDGWETRRRRGPGHDWAVVRLGRAGTIRRAIVDTTHFKGNAPGACSLDACALPGEATYDAPGENADWRPLLPRTQLLPHTAHEFADALHALEGVTHVRLNIFPDGGVARLRLFGGPA